MLMGRKLAVTLAFAGLLLVAFGAGCRGFFVAPTLTSITISPTAPAVQVGTTSTLSAYGVNNDGSGSYLTSGVSWSSSDTTIATVSGTGSAQLTGVSTGTATITATSEAVTNTASATVFITISAIAMSPTSANLSTGSGTQAFLVYANNDPTLTNPADNLSSGATLTVTLAGQAVTTIACSYVSSDSPPNQVCTASVASPGSYVVTATYPGSNLTATATLNVQ